MSPELPPHTSSGLLEGIAENALDDDYYEVRPPRSSNPRGVGTVVAGVGIAFFALLVTIGSVQNRNEAPTNRVERNTLVSDIQSRKSTLDKGEAQTEKLRSDVTKLQALSNDTNPDYENLRVTTGDSAASGSGIVIVADNSTGRNTDGRVTDVDLQILVNGLWYAGAEAISINGNRLGTLSSIRSVDGAMTVNFRSIGSPYRLVVLGDSQSLNDRLDENAGGRYWAERVRQAGLRFDLQREGRLNVPAVPAQRVTITHATAVKGDS
ncbi:MAG: DUF881 domain-containing protein [Kineosporiaceae bacterium]|nr:DUF881 domain-containing protein [Aeromicrobium sp.]